MDIRKNKPVEPKTNPDQPIPEDPIQSWLKANRHNLGPFKPGAIIQPMGDSFVQVDSNPDTTEINKHRQTIEEDVKTAKVNLPPNFKSKIPPPVDFNSLPPEKQKAILDSLEEAKNKLNNQGLSKAEPIKPESKVLGGTGEHVEAKAGGYKPVWAAKPKLREDQPVKVSNNPGLPENFSESINVLEFLNKVDEAEKEVSKEEENKTEEEKTNDDKPVSAGGGLPEKRHCDHCGWDLANPDHEDPTEMDKLGYLQCMLGGINFSKEYELMNGNVGVRFRTLTSIESDTVYTKTALEVRSGNVLDEHKYFRTLADYRLALAISRLRCGDQVFNLPDNIDNWETDDKDHVKKLSQIVDWMYNNPLKLEPMRRAVGTMYFRFSRLVEKLEARWDDPNFWPPVENSI